MVTLNYVLIFLLIGRLLCETCLRKLNASCTQSILSQPKRFADFIDTDTLQGSVAYTLANNQFALCQLFYETMWAACILFSGIIPYFLSKFDTLTSSNLGQGIAFFIWITCLHLCSLPLDYFHQFTIEKNFGFNRSTKRLWFADQVKGIVVSALINVPLFTALLYFVQAFPRSWYVWGTFAYFFLQLVMVWIYPKVFLPFFNKLTPLEEGSLKTRLTALAQRSGFKATAIQVLDSSKRSSHSNAYCSSLGRIQHIVLYDTLLKDFSEDEIEAIVAHEMGHYKHKHILKILLFSTLSMALVLKLCDIMLYKHWFSSQLGLTTLTTPLMLLTWLYVCMPLFTYWTCPLSNYFSRRFEYEADQFAKEQSSSCGHHLIQALKKLYKTNLGNLYPHPWFSFFHYSHPTLLEREKHLTL